MADYSLFPGVIPTSDELDRSYVTKEVFEDNYPLMRQAVVVISEQYDHEIEINGKSNKIEMSDWMANNMTKEGLETVRQKAEERINE